MHSSADGLVTFFVNTRTLGPSLDGNGKHVLLTLARRNAPLVSPPSRLWYVSATILPPALVRWIAASSALRSAPSSSFTTILNAMKDFVAA